VIWVLRVQLFLLVIAIVFPCLAQDEAAEKRDDMGCYVDYVTEAYVCDEGPLAGREFINKAAAKESLKTLKKDAEKYKQATSEVGPAPAPDARAGKKAEAPAVPPDQLRFISWNMRSLVHDGSDYDRAAIVLADADLIALQEIDLKGQGKGFINVLADLVQAKAKQKICRAWVHDSSGERQSYGFMWKESSVGFVDGEGAMSDSCGMALIIRQAKPMKYGSRATFYLKAPKKFFEVVTMFSDKQPGREVSDLFRAVNDSKWPVLMAGDLKMSPGNSNLKDTAKYGFHSALRGGRAGWDNFWYRKTGVKNARRINLYEHFSDARRQDIQRSFVGISPITADFDLKEEVKESTILVPKVKPKQKVAKRSAKVSAKPKRKVTSDD
jgi:hypothetical protein